MMKRIIVFVLCVLLCVPALSSCKKAPAKYTEYSFDYFDTVTTITGYAASQAEFDRISGDVLARLGEYHKLYTIYHRFQGMENLCTVNELLNGAHRTVTVDRRIIDLLLYAKEMYEKTGGKVNIAMGSVLSIWHDYRTEGSDEPWNAKLPPMEELAEAAKHTDIENILIDEAASTVTLADPKMKLDVGAVAKGWSVQKVAEKAPSGLLISVGGNVCATGAKDPSGTPWVVGITDPNGGNYLHTIENTDKSVVTSGDYQRYFVVDGKMYHHIIDPATLMPAEYFSSVTIITEDSGLADALSTALFCMSYEEGKSLVESLDVEVDVIWIDLDYNLTKTEGILLVDNN